MKYHVKLEPTTVWGKDVVVEAESMSEAIEIAQNRHCGKEQVEISYSPTNVEPHPKDADEDWELFEYNYQVYGKCDDCGVVLFESYGEKNPDNDWPWQHDAGDTRHQTYVCYPCAMKRKEAGNYCSFYKHFYRSYKEGCDTCPPVCFRARDSYFDALRTVLGRALALSALPKDEESQSFLEANEFGLAFEGLESIGSNHERDPRFATNMVKAAEMMAEGWE